MTAPLVLPFGDIWPRIAEDAYLAPGAVIVGDVELGPGTSVWFNATIRGDVAPIRIGRGSNVQDNAVLHVDAGQPCRIGDDVTIGHGAIVHGCTVGNGVTIGMGAILLSRATVGVGAIIAAGALVTEDQIIEPGVLAMGIPARAKRALSEDEQEGSRDNARRYVRNAARYREQGVGHGH